MNILKPSMNMPFGTGESAAVLVIPPVISIAVTSCFIGPSSSPIAGLIIFPVVYMLSMFLTFCGMTWIIEKKMEKETEIQKMYKDNKELGLHQYIFSIEDFWPSKTKFFYETDAFISVDEIRNKILIGGAAKEKTEIISKLIEINDVISFELLEMGYVSQKHTSLGGLHFGSTGVVINTKLGGSNLAKLSTVSVLGVKLTLDMIETPIISINFISNSMSRESEEYQKALSAIEEWLAILRILKNRSLLKTHTQ